MLRNDKMIGDTTIQPHSNKNAKTADSTESSPSEGIVCAPVVIPTLNRHVCLKRLIESLAANSWAKYTDLYIGLDYPPTEKYVEGWEKTKQYLHEGDFSAFKSFNVIKRHENYGYFKNTDDLRETVYRDYDRHILLADDLEVSPNFLEYIDRCLDHYHDDPDVAIVCGFSYPIDWHVSEGATCLKQNVNASEWGIGFWRDKEAVMRPYIENDVLSQQLPEAARNDLLSRMIYPCLDEYICAASLPKILRKHFCMVRQVCDISMRAYLAVASKYAISPVISKVRQYGFDGSGLYCQRINMASDGNTARTYNYFGQPIDKDNTFSLREDTLHDNAENRRRLNNFDRRSPRETLLARQLAWICRHLSCGIAKTYYTTLFSLWILPARVAGRHIKRTIKTMKSKIKS